MQIQIKIHTVCTAPLRVKDLLGLLSTLSQLYMRWDHRSTVLIETLGQQYITRGNSIQAVSYEEIFPRNFGVGGVKNFFGKKSISYEETFPKKFFAQNFLRKKKLEYSQPRKFSSPKFPRDKRKFYEEILGSLDNRTEISTPSQYWMMPTAVRTHDYLCSLLFSHMHRVTQTLPQEP